MVKRLTLLLLLYCLLAPAPSWAATFTASVDSKQLYADEQILLTLSLLNSDTRLRAEGLDPNVDLSILTRDFDVGVPRASHRYNIYRNRGRSTSEIQVLLFPKHSGTLHIPSFSVDGLHSKAITLEIHAVKAKKNPPVFLRSGTTKQDLWVGEQTLAYLDLYHRINLKSARLGGDLDTEPLRLHLTSLPQQERSTTVDGLTYKVSRSIWSITPVEAKPLSLKFPDAWVETTTGERIHLPFTESRIEVRPLPPDTPAGILVGEPRLEQNLPAGTHTSHQPTPWHITLWAPVALQALPAKLPFTAPPTLKIYFDAPKRDWEENKQGTLISVARYSGYIIPLTEGRLTLPTLELPYFDPQEGQMKQARLPGANLEVTGGAVPIRPHVTPSSNPSAVPGNPSISAENSDNVWWQATAILFALLWLFTTLLWWQRRRSAAACKQTTAPHKKLAGTTSRPPMIRALAAALQAQSLEDGVERWEQQQGPDQQLRKLVCDLQAFYYAGAGNGGMDSARLEEAVRQFVKRSHRSSGKKTTGDPWLPESFARDISEVSGKE